MDKNGRLVTKHVRAIAPTGNRKILPAPALTRKTKGFVPLEKQLTPRVHNFSRDSFKTNSAVERAFSGWAETRDLSFNCNDVDAYDVLSVLRPLDALAAINGGAKSAAYAEDVARRNGLEGILTDNSAITDEALRRRIPATSFIAISNRVNKTGREVPTERLLDAAEVHGNKTLQEMGFHVDVLRGHISLADLKAVGAPTIAGHVSIPEIRTALWEIQTGESPCDAKELKKFIQKANDAECAVTVPLNLARRYGVDFTMELNDVADALDLLIRMGSDKDHDALSEDTKAFVKYYDELGRVRKEVGPRDDYNIDDDAARDMFDAGIEPRTAMDAIEQDMTSVQVLAIRDYDIAPSVSGGWL